MHQTPTSAVSKAGSPTSAISPHFSPLSAEIEWGIDRKALGLNSDQLAALRAIGRWRNCLLCEGEDQKDQTTYLQTMGHLPKGRNIVTSARRRALPEEVFLGLIEAVVRSDISPSRITTANPAEFTSRYTGMSTPQFKLLQSIVKQEMRLANIDLSELRLLFPFPVTEKNFFGRFVAEGCGEPQQAIRHLKLCAPFFVRMRTMLEGLANDRFRCLSVHFAGDQGQDRHRLGNSPVQQTILSCINHAWDFSGNEPSPAVKSPLCTIKVPWFIEIAHDHISKADRSQFAAEFCDWLFFGKRDGELLSKKSLSKDREETYKRNVAQVAILKGRIARRAASKPEIKNDPVRAGRWQSAQDRLEDRLNSLRATILQDDEERRDVVPVLKAIEDEETLMRDVHRFRRQFQEARERKLKIVYSFLHYDDVDVAGEDLFLKLFDRAMATKKFAGHPGVRALREGSYLLTEEAASVIDSHRVSGSVSLKVEQIRGFPIDPRELTPSLEYVVAGLLPERTDPKVSVLLSAIQENCAIPGIHSVRHLKYLVKKCSGQQSPKVFDYLQYALERAPSLPKERLLAILDTLNAMGVCKLPQSCVDLITERFHHPKSLLDQYQAFASSYHPKKLGQPPAVFEDLASFDRYAASRLEPFGMNEEVQQLEKLLSRSGIVTIVDGTNYHPEFASKSDGRSDREKTNEIWGEYVRPSERLIASLAHRLIEGASPVELKDHSLVGVKKPDEKAKNHSRIIKVLYGIDIDINPNLAELNKLIAALALYDSKTILVMDAQQIKDMEQYRQFLQLLGKYELKIIVKTREPIPGIPRVLVQPFMDHEIPARLSENREALGRQLDLANPPSQETFQFVSEQVEKLRQSASDPLNLNLQVIRGAAQNARLHGAAELTEQDIVVALPPIFHLPDCEQMRQRIRAIDVFAERAPMEVLGQAEPIRTVADLMTSHMLGLRDPARPLTMLWVGPTGVGKTELAARLALAADISFFPIEGAQFSEPHTVSRLIGSPTGYVGPDKGILYLFLEQNVSGIVFIDEIEKMHPAVYTALINFFDKATLTAGNAELVTRPGMVIIGASNAGAERLYRDMGRRKLREVLSDAFVDAQGNRRPELVARFDPIMMLAIEKDAFRDVIKTSIGKLCQRFGLISANMRVVGIDPAASELLYEEAKEVCEFSEKSKFGFNAGATHRKGPADLYYDMRHVGRALDRLAGASVRELVKEQYRTRRYADRSSPRRLLLKAVQDPPAIVLVDE